MRTINLYLIMLLTSNYLVQATKIEQKTKIEQYFLGEIKLFVPDGRQIGMSLSLTKRVLDPLKNIIEENIIQVDSDFDIEEFRSVFIVNGSNFQIKDEERGFIGTGQLLGTPWSWVSWNYKAILSDESVILSQNQLTDDGLIAKRELINKDNKVSIVFLDDSRIISKAMYAILRASFTKTK